MSADLHIHVYEGLVEDDLRLFFSHTIGSKWCGAHQSVSIEEDSKNMDKVGGTPNVWVGGVSWLKAALFANPDKYIPSPVMQVNDIIGEDLPVIDDELIERISEALMLENTTGYRVSSAGDVVLFLEEHRGKRVFTISW